MPTRVLALLLACVLLWSGFGTIEPPQAFAPTPADESSIVAMSEGAPISARHGSVQHHHLDDQPSQVPGDAGTENPGMLPAALGSTETAFEMAPPRARGSAALCAPFLAGPLRPPCGARVIA